MDDIARVRETSPALADLLAHTSHVMGKFYDHDRPIPAPEK